MENDSRDKDKQSNDDERCNTTYSVNNLLPVVDVFFHKRDSQGVIRLDEERVDASGASRLNLDVIT